MAVLLQQSNTLWLLVVAVEETLQVAVVLVVC
jgi:hypothetical protein